MTSASPAAWPRVGPGRGREGWPLPRFPLQSKGREGGGPPQNVRKRESSFSRPHILGPRYSLFLRGIESSRLQGLRKLLRRSKAQGFRESRDWTAGISCYSSSSPDSANLGIPFDSIPPKKDRQILRFFLLAEPSKKSSLPPTPLLFEKSRGGKQTADRRQPQKYKYF
jgi:hypothetical protein